MNKTNRNILYYTPAIGWGILILYFSLLPGPKVPDLLKSIEDFFLHFAIYFLFSSLLSLGSSHFVFKKIKASSVLLFFALSFVIGGGVELIQEFFILNRTGGWDDLMANSLGALFGLLSIRLFSKE